MGLVENLSHDVQRCTHGDRSTERLLDLGLFGRLAPKGLTATTIAVWFSAGVLGNLFAGWLGTSARSACPDSSIALFAMREIGASLGLPPQGQEKVEYACNAAMPGLESMRGAGVKVGFGSDLLGPIYNQQCREFTLRREVFTPLEILRQVTSVGAEVLMQEGKLGCVAMGALADLIIVDGDPLVDIALLARNGTALSLIMRDGKIVKNRLRA